jgi:hypothetical protein
MILIALCRLSIESHEAHRLAERTERSHE